MTKRSPKIATRCADCRGLGFVLSVTSGSELYPDETMKVQKCDTCDAFPHDEVAEEVAARILDHFLDTHAEAARYFGQQENAAILARWRRWDKDQLKIPRRRR